MNKISNLIFAIGAIALLAACSDPDPRPPEEIVAERAQARWDALVESEFDEAWTYMTPGFREHTDSRDYYVEMSSRSVQWTSAEVVSTECEQARCEVTVSVGYRIPSGPAQLSGMESERRIKETWIGIDGKWWYAQ